MDEVKTPSTSGEAVEMAMMHLRSVQQFAAYDQMPEANLNLSVAQVYATMANALPSELQQAAYDGSQYARANVVQGERERLRQRTFEPRVPEHRGGIPVAHVVPNERGMVTCNGVIYTEGEPGKCWVAEDHTTITDPEIIAMLEGALFQAILKGNDPAPTQGDQQ